VRFLESLVATLTFEVSVSLDNAVVWSFSPCATCSGRPGMSFAGGDDAKQEVADVIGEAEEVDIFLVLVNLVGSCAEESKAFRLWLKIPKVEEIEDGSGRIMVVGRAIKARECY
jgi:hypothetical protein